MSLGSNINFAFTSLLNRIGKENLPFIVWREEDLFNALAHPVRIEFPGFFLCLSGTLELEINLQHHILGQQELLYFSVNYAVRIIHRSPDFRCVGVLFSTDYWKRILLSEQSFRTITVQNSVIPITPAERQRVYQFYELLLRNIECEEHTYKEEILYHILVGMLYQVWGICEKYISEMPPASKNDQLFFNFLNLLYQHFRSHRDVGFYANKLGLNQRYMTTVIRQVSGKSAVKWIDDYTILEAQIMLRSSGESIKEIAYRLNFNEQSLFTKYFKRLTGQSPDQYRKQL